MSIATTQAAQTGMFRELWHVEMPLSCSPINNQGTGSHPHSFKLEREKKCCHCVPCGFSESHCLCLVPFTFLHSSAILWRCVCVCHACESLGTLPLLVVYLISFKTNTIGRDTRKKRNAATLRTHKTPSRLSFIKLQKKYQCWKCRKKKSIKKKASKEEAAWEDGCKGQAVQHTDVLILSS